MLKERTVLDCNLLFPKLQDESVSMYVREKATTLDGYIDVFKKSIEKEFKGDIIARTIIEPNTNNCIGVIQLYDIQQKYGFLSTWIGTDYQGKGYNKTAKELFFLLIFKEYGIENVFIKIKKENIKSTKAINKFSYVEFANETHKNIYENIENKEVFNLFSINKSDFLSYFYTTYFYEDNML